ncbi:glucose-6-phosphate isomerase [Sediminicola luteus]|uniref:Glucose-6-phosphate isomerase n=1 Tax=Sediminicola luteus TaxID=319238 RepID=A0A2A4G4D3_9FLAO|nr:glucose-6-phosphate isomerase [Sediminicola luteus]PCE62838.1 glucose-6-phosphate isomerase [Sediminicola luteus]
MSLPHINPTTTKAWQALGAHFAETQADSINDYFAQDPKRAEKFSLAWEDFFLDYSKNKINETTLSLLIDLAKEVGLEEGMKAYFKGDAINQTENRAVLHTALRAPKTASIFVDGENVVPEVHAVKASVRQFVEAVISGTHKGYTGKTITDVVNIGIGGSDLGPAMVVEALKYYENHLKVHFVSNVDGDHTQEVLKGIDPETTLFVVVSKTFTTQETISNATTIKEWFLQSAQPEDVAKHFAAVSTNIPAVTEFGIHPANVFPMWDWVGGRFSLWSAVGISIALAIGYDGFEDLLAGAHAMDTHFKEAPMAENMPVLMGLVSVWYNNFHGAETEALIPYTQYLARFAAYLQQGVMESNGKHVDRTGKGLDYQSGTIVWGEPGTNSQHAFFQLIHQGTKLIPTDFIGFKKALHGKTDHHDKLMANFFAQTEALLQGKTEETVKNELECKGMSAEEVARLLPFKVFPGDKPTNTLLIEKLSPKTLGSLIALYEHKIFVQGLIWNIFSYDQWGVELGKQLAGNILKEIQNNAIGNHDASTANLLKLYKQ